MLVTIVKFDKPDQAKNRKIYAPAHSKYVREKLPPKALFSGSLFSDDGKTIVGTMFIAEFKSLDGARLFHKGDPYKTAGIYDRVLISPSVTKSATKPVVKKTDGKK